MPRPFFLFLALLGLPRTLLAADGPLPPLPAASEPSTRLSATLHDAFEAGRPSWRQEETDATVDLRLHDRTDRAAHDGKASERLQFAAGPGTYLYYSYALPRIPLSSDLRAILYVKSNHPGLQLSGRVVLPNDIDPETRQPAFLMIPGGSYDQVDRWQRLEVAEIVRAVEAQARILRAASNGRRKVSLEGAYLERLVVNLYGTPGEAEAFLDDLTIAPVPEGAVVVAEGGNPAQPRSAPSVSRIRLDGDQLTRDGYDWVPSIIRAPGADLATLREYGFDVLSVDMDTDPERVRDAVRRGFLLLPHLNSPIVSPPRTPQDVGEEMTSYPFKDSVAFWYLGDALGADPDKAGRREELHDIRSVIGDLHERPEGFPRLATASVSGLFSLYVQPGQNLDLVGVHPAPWGTAMDPLSTLRYLEQRRNLTALNNPRAFYWSWIQARPPATFRRSVWGDDRPPAWGVPHVQPEQLRIWTYASLAAGYRGLGFLGDADLTKGMGRALLYEMAILRAEVDLVESIIARGQDPIPLLDTFFPDPEQIVTFNPMGNQGGLGGMGNRQQQQQQPKEMPAHPTIKAASVATRDNRGRLLLVSDYMPGVQWQAPQMATSNLKLMVRAPETSQALLFSPGGWKILDHERTTGGIRVTIPEFNIAAMVLVTTDLDLIRRIQKEVTKIAPTATTLAINQAQLLYEETYNIDAMLVRLGHTPEGVSGLLKEAQEAIAGAREFHARGEYDVAWSRAQVAGRALRILKHNHFTLALEEFGKVSKTSQQKREELVEKERVRWNKLNRDKYRPRGKGPFYPRLLVSPMASPPMVTFNTLPQHYLWMGWAKDGTYGPNLLPAGDFENAKTGELPEDWEDVGYETEGITTSFSISEPKDGGWKKESRKILQFSVRPDSDHKFETLPPYLDHPVVAVRTPPIKVGAKQFVRIRAMVRMLIATPPGTGGFIVRDSLGGEALQFRSTEGFGIEWRELVLYRRATSDTELTVTFGLAGFGIAEIDDVRIDRIEQLPSVGDPSAEVARRLPPRRPAAAANARSTR